MTPITRWTLWQRRWSIFWWCLGIIGLIVLTLVFYPSIRNQTEQLDKSFNQIPQSARALFTDTSDLFSPVGYLSSQLFYLMLPMLLSILSIGLGSSLIAKEETAGTLELLLSRPVSRGRVVLGKALAGLGVVLSVSIVALLATLIMCKLVNIDIGLTGVVVATAYSVALAVLFGSLAFFIASIGRYGRLASIGLTVLFALTGYIISSLSSAVSWLHYPAKVFPYHYYHPGEILSGSYSFGALLIYLLISVVLVWLAFIAFRRRDLSS